MPNEPVVPVVEPVEPPVTPPTEPEKTYTAEEYKIIASEKKAEKEKAKSLQVEVDKYKAQVKKIEDDKLKASGDTDTLLKNIQKELEDATSKITELEIVKTEKDELETKVKKDLYAKLSDDHLKIAKKLSIPDLQEYVDLNSKDKTPGQDSGRSGRTPTDINGKSYNDFTSKELDEIKKGNPGGWKKLYREYYKREPAEANTT